MDEDEASATQFSKPEITESHFMKEAVALAIPEELQRISEKVNIADFDIIRMIGEGSFGKVLLVQHKEEGTLFALKTLSKGRLIKLLQVEHTKAERRYSL